MFSLGSEEPQKQFKGSVFKHADPSNLGRSHLEGNKDHLLGQAKSELMREEHQVESLYNCISELQQQAYAQGEIRLWRSKSFMSSPSITASVNCNDKQKSKDWRYRTHNTDLFNPDENKFVYEMNYL